MIDGGDLLVTLAAAFGGLSLVAARRPDARPALGIAAAGLLVVLALAVALPDRGPSRETTGATLVAETPYLRSVLVAWAASTLTMTLSAALAATPARLLAAASGASLLAIAAGGVALGTGDAVAGALAALVAGLAGIAAGTGFVRDDRGTGVVTRELRAIVVASVGVAVGSAALPALAASVEPGAAAGAGTSLSSAPALGAAVLAVGTGAAIRFGAIPFHLWVARAADVIPAVALPVTLGWTPLLLGSVALVAVQSQLVPLTGSVGAERSLIALVAVVTIAAAPLAAWIQDDLEHSFGYIAVGNAGVALLALATLHADAWGPARSWLVVTAVSVTALSAWLAVLSRRFDTRRLPELDGWARRSPIAAIALVVATMAFVGLPGWLPFEARRQLAELALGAPVGTLVAVGGLLLAAPIVRVLGVGVRRPSSTVTAVPGELDALASRVAAWRTGATAMRTTGPRTAARVGTAAMAATRENRALLSSLALLVTSLIAVGVATGGLDLADVAAQPPPPLPGTALER